MNTVLKKINPCKLFIVIGIINLLVIAASLWITNGEFLSQIVWDAKNVLFSDFVFPQSLVVDKAPYNVNNLDAQYPALAYFVFYLIKGFIPKSIEYSNVNDWYNLFAVIVLCTCMLCITHITEQFFYKSSQNAFFVLLIFYLSLPFAFAEVKCINSSIFVLVLILSALYFKNSSNKALKELALILIAIAAGFKITPAIWGILYIKEKRWKEAARLIVYGIIFFFVPFLFFGKDSFEIFLKVNSVISTQLRPRPETIMGVCLEIGSVTGLGLVFGRVIGQILSFSFLALTVFVVFATKYDWKSIFLITNLMIVFVNGAYPYTMQYLLIPIIFFYITEEQIGHRKIDYIFSFMLAMTLTSYPFFRINWPTATFITNYFWLYLLIIMVCIDKVVESAVNIKSKQL